MFDHVVAVRLLVGDLGDEQAIRFLFGCCAQDHRPARTLSIDCADLDLVFAVRRQMIDQKLELIIFVFTSILTVADRFQFLRINDVYRDV